MGFGFLNDQVCLRPLIARLCAPILLVLINDLLYDIFLETKVAWSVAWPGALISTNLIIAEVVPAGFFLEQCSLNSGLQVAGAFTSLLVGFYYVAQIFLLCAINCWFFSAKLGSRRSEIFS